MDKSLLVSAHLSSLYTPAHITSIPLQTSRRDTPLAPNLAESDPPPEHAIFSNSIHSSGTGTILLRVLHGGLILELTSLTSEVSPIRFIFPAVVLPAPGIFISESLDIHVLAVTASGSLYRLVLPAGDAGQLWQGPLGRHWCREYEIQHGPRSLQGLVQVQGLDCVAIGLQNGDMLRLEAQRSGADGTDDHWNETIFHTNSFLSTFTSFLQSGQSGAQEFISMASHPQPTDIGSIVSLSRDRTLRVWAAKGGCTSARTLPTVPVGRATTPVPGGSTPTTKSTALLDGDPQNLIRIYNWEGGTRAMVFIPSPASSTSGGFFHVFDLVQDVLNSTFSVECPPSTAHCHLQDFAVTSGCVYTLWDRQGQSSVDYALFDSTLVRGPEAGAMHWISASYAKEIELTPAYLDEMLLSHGSLVDRLFEVIMRPGTFSTLTLRTAIEQYTDACLTLPGTQPHQLRSGYATVGENIAAVVGCTVTLTRDPQTGAQQHDKYWNALKRDWEGFIARCREIERSARRPLALTYVGATQSIILVERERVGMAISEDLPLRVQRKLDGGALVDPSFALLEVLWKLRSQLGTVPMMTLENHVVDLVQQEIAFPFADIIVDQAERSGFREDLDEGMEVWINGRLQGIADLDHATRATLDLIGGLDKEVKREEQEVELLLPSSYSQWTRALTASYVSASVEARYQLSLALVALLFFVAEDLDNWDTALLAEIFAVFRGIAMLRAINRLPGGDSSGTAPPDDGTAADEVVARLRNMHVTNGRAGKFTPTYSLLHRLLSQGADLSEPASAAHRFLDTTGLLQSTSPAHATKLEVLFCERLRLIGCPDVSRDMLGWLPRTPAVNFVLARLLIDGARGDDAASLMQTLAGSFGAGSALSYEDADALAAVLPGSQLFDSEFSFYLCAAGLFRAASEVYHDVHFSQLALSVAPQDAPTFELWLTIIKGHTDLAQYEDAYSALISTPYDKMKRECVNQLVYRMCEESAVEKLMSLNWATLTDDVEEALSFKARNADPRVRPFYSRILYSWYIARGDYRNAAAIIYQRARRLGELAVTVTDSAAIGELQLEAYVVAMNAMALLDQKDAWIVVPASADGPHEPSRKRRRLAKYIPDSQFAPGKKNVEMVTLNDIRFEYALVGAQLDLKWRDPSLLNVAPTLLSPTNIVSRLALSNRFNTAMVTARDLDEDMTMIFTHLTSQCLRLSRDPNAVVEEDTSDWLLDESISMWTGSPAERGWRYLRRSLERHDSVATDFKYTKAAFDAVIGSGRTEPLPPWLVAVLVEHHPEYLIRACLKYEELEYALQYTLALIRKDDAKLARNPPKAAASTWLPYTLIDQVLVLSKPPAELTARAKAYRRDLDLELTNRVKRMQKYSRAGQ